MSNFDYFKFGGTLGEEDPTYISRQADKDLYEGIINRAFCYVLTSRQMGKSSLGIHILNKLQKEDYACVFIDLGHEIGTANSADNWYYSFASSINRILMANFDLQKFWRQDLMKSPISKFREYIETHLLKVITTNIVIFIDEINNICCQSFILDDFFAFIRSCYNSRANQPEYQRLSFVIFGFTTPTELIKNPSQTPFNIGKEIELKGFEIHEVDPLIQGLTNNVANPINVMKDILNWTGGQPFLTQKVSALIVKASRQGKFHTVENILLTEIIEDWESKDNPVHFKAISNFILHDVKTRKGLLLLYKEILHQEIINKADNYELKQLMLSGLTKNINNKVQLYNKIYPFIFNKDWIENNLIAYTPYMESYSAWYASGKRDRSRLLRGEALRDAIKWSSIKDVSEDEDEFINASIKAEKIGNFWTILTSITIMPSILLVLAIIVLFLQTYKTTYCLAEGQLIDKSKDNCFRYFTSSGDKNPWVSNTNYFLDEGVKSFIKGDYMNAMDDFNRAKDADLLDPVPVIYFNNAMARYVANKNKNSTLQLAVVVAVDYYEATAKQVLRGVADAQTKFNLKGGSKGRLLEISIANDGKTEITKAIALMLANQKDILGIVGHFTSEWTQIALPDYMKKQVALVSPTSTSSELGKHGNADKSKTDKSMNVLFRTLKPTTDAAQEICNILHAKKYSEVYVYYEEDSLYSNSFYTDFSNFSKKKDCATISVSINISNPASLGNNLNNHNEYILKNKIPAILLFSGVKTNSVAIAIARETTRYFKDKNVPIPMFFGSLALAEQATIDQGGDSVNGMLFALPCLNSKPSYKDKWNATPDWRLNSSYDATQALIKAIELSKGTPTRETVLQGLRSLNLSDIETSGYGVEWSNSNNSNMKAKYCPFQIQERKGNPQILEFRSFLIPQLNK